MSAYELTREQLSILDHTATRAAGGLYCGDGPDMDRLVELGLMEFAGRKSFVPDGYYTLTAAGRAARRDRAVRLHAGICQHERPLSLCPECSDVA